MRRIDFTGARWQTIAAFAVLLAGCFPPQMGTLSITAVTSGVDVDADGYRVTIRPVEAEAPAEARSLTPNGTVSEDLVATNYQIELSGIAENCSVDGGNPRTANVVENQSTAVTFMVTCTSSTGQLIVGVTTSGSDLDQDGYSVTVGSIERTVGQNDEVRMDLAPDQYEVRLGGVADNCELSGTSARTATVVAGRDERVSFTVTCALLQGTIEVTTSTTGSQLDGDGYEIQVGSIREPIGVNGTRQVEVDRGMWQVTLHGVSPNCRRDDPTSSTVNVEVAADRTARVSFAIRCVPIIADRIVFESDRDGQQELYSVDRRGNDLQSLNSGPAARPSVSPDGTMIAFVNAGINVMDTDGNGRIRLTTDATDRDPAWSSDGSRIAFRSARDGQSEVYVVNLDGSGLQNLTNHPGNDGYPSWSPDSPQLIFESDRTGKFDIYVMNADGTNLSQVTANDGQNRFPSWSPNGSHIAYTSTWETLTGDPNDDQEIFVMAFNVWPPEQITRNSSNDRQPDWSPDGTRLVWQRDMGNGHFSLFTKSTASRGSALELTPGPTRDLHPSWSRVVEAAIRQARR